MLAATTSTCYPGLGPRVSPEEARRLLRAGNAPAGLRVNGPLVLTEEEGAALPPGLQTRRLDASACRELRALPHSLCCTELDLRHTAIEALPDDLQVEYRLDLEGCANLERLPAALAVGSLVLRDCTALEALPEGLDVAYLDLEGCTGLRGWPARGQISPGRLSLGGCAQVESLPEWLGPLAQLDVSGCASLATLPERLVVRSWIEVAGSGLRSLPPGCAGAELQWRGVPVEERAAFRPETITAREVLGEANLERRRVLMERMGYEVFLREAGAEELDRDRDPGGERRLLRVPLPGDEDLVCVAVLCPSTGRRYVLRVPPTMQTCRQAIAWTAGFDDPDQYRPLAET